MTNIRLNARDYLLEVQDDDDTTWLSVPNLRQFTINPSENEVTEETTDFDDAGHYKEEYMQRGASLTLSTFDIVDDTTGVRPAGHARLDELGALFGYESTGSVRFRHVQSDTWIVWASATIGGTERGGETNAKSGNGWTVRRGGAPSTAAVA